MIAEATDLLIDESQPRAFDDFITSYVNEWLAGCHQFMIWHRKHILECHPTDEDLRNEERVLPWMIRVARALHGQMLDPNWPHPRLAGEVETSLWQLEQAWAQTHNPMGEAEADMILREVFPSK